MRHKVFFTGILISFVLSSCNNTTKKVDNNPTNDSAASIVLVDKSTPEKVVAQPDRFVTYKKTERYHLNTEWGTDEGQEDPSYNVGHKSLDLQWPVYLNGVTQLPILQDHLMILIFGKSCPDIQSAMAEYWDLGMIDECGPYDPGEEITLKRVKSNNPNFVQFILKRMLSLGGGTGASVSFTTQGITYDKRVQKILRKKDILKNPHSLQLVQVLNKEIKRIMKVQNEEYNLLSKMPDKIIVGDKGLTFVCPDCIQFTYQGDEIEVFVPYFRIANYLTNDFKQSINMQ
jgi:lipoprotein